ncbi:MAG: hypothetical protein H7301_04385 [Cryobacterium sp.]|nr:hypothetical protein [Oligoflexia bacterium]
MGQKLIAAWVTFIACSAFGSALAGECKSSAMADAKGDYAGCQVSSQGKTFVIGLEQSSAAGCQFVCSILSEVNERAPVKKTSARLRASASESG